MKRKLILLLSAAMLFACSDDEKLTGPGNNGNEPVIESQFATTATVTLNLTDKNKTRYLIFFNNPYSPQVDYIGTPVFSGVSPIRQEVVIPNDVKTIYVLSNGMLTTYSREEFAIFASGTAASAPSKLKNIVAGNGNATDTVISSALISYIHREIFPEKVSVADSDTLLCSDLVVGKDSADVWITFLSCGGAVLDGKLGYYTYTEEGTYQNYDSYGNPSRMEVINNIFGRTKVNGPLSQDRKPAKKYIGRFAPGQKIGFIYTGDPQMSVKYSTPSRNREGRTFGLIREIVFEGKTFSVLGMENRGWYDHNTYYQPDWDYNDILCLVESTPVIHPMNEIPVPPTEPSYTTEYGLYLFEDNCPYEGDYDFNDVVVKYKFVKYFEENYTEAEFEPLAIGASYTNSLLVNGATLISDLSGFYNVNANGPTKSFDRLKTRLNTTDITVQLNNGKTLIGLETFNPHSTKYPFALNIPDTTFRWCREMNRIDNAYNLYNTWVENGCGEIGNDWYKTEFISDETAVY